MTRRANGPGALVGALAGAAAMYGIWKYTSINGYPYTATGIAVCFLVGYAVSLVVPAQQRDLTGLTVYTMDRSS
jgi:hypothetical protein